MSRCPEHRPFREVKFLYLEASVEDQDWKAAWGWGRAGYEHRELRPSTVSPRSRTRARNQP